MPTVYVRDDRPHRVRFHRTKDCVQLQKKPARGAPRPLKAVDLNEVHLPKPCFTCYPDVPRLPVAHRYCHECNGRTARACPHNGGVPVLQTLVRQKYTMISDPGDEYVRRHYVWPELAHLYT